jgi:hypothetical protein
MAKNLATCFRSLASELDRLGEIRVKGIKIEPVERKLVVTLAGEDPEILKWKDRRKERQ